MKFIEAIKAMGPGQMLINPNGARLEIRDGFLWLLGMSYPPDRVLYQDKDGWKVEDKPRPRVTFADAIAAAAKGATIRSCSSDGDYVVKDGVPMLACNRDVVQLTKSELMREWEIIEAEGDK